MSVKWTDEKTLKLIHAVKRNRVNHRNYHFQHDKQNEVTKNWNSVSDECKESVSSCKKQWSKIVDNYLNSSPKAGNRRLTRTAKFYNELTFLETPDQEISSKVNNKSPDNQSQSTKDKLKSRSTQINSCAENENAIDCQESLTKPPPICPIIIRKKIDKKEHEIRRKSIEKSFHKTQNISSNTNEKNSENNENNIAAEDQHHHTNENSIINSRQSEKRKREIVKSDVNEITKRMKYSKDTLCKTSQTSKCYEEPIKSDVDHSSNKNKNQKASNGSKNQNAITPKQIKLEKSSNHKLYLNKQHKGIQCELLSDSNDFDIIKSIKPHYNHMNTRQKLLFNSKLYQSLLEVLGDSTDFENNSTLSSYQNSHLSNFNLKSMELHLINQLAAVVLATKGTDLNDSNSRSLISHGTTTTTNSPTLEDRCLLKETNISTPPLQSISTMRSEFPLVNEPVTQPPNTQVVSRISTTVSTSLPKFIIKNLPVLSGAKSYSNTSTSNTVSSVTSTVNAPKTSFISSNVSEEKVSGVRSGELLKYTDDGGKTKVLYRFITPKLDSENANVPISTEKGTFVVPKIPKMMIQKASVTKPLTKVITIDPASNLRMNRRNSTTNNELTSKQIIKTKSLTCGDVITANLHKPDLIRQGSGENKTYISSPSKIIENLNQNNIRFLNNISVGNIVSNISSVNNRNIGSNGPTIVRVDENAVLIGSNTTRNNNSGITIANINNGQKQQIIQNTENKQVKNFNDVSGNILNLNPTFFSRPKIFRRQSVCGDGRVITTSANITPYNFQQNPVISSIDSLRAFRIREGQIQRPETVTTATSGTRISTGINLSKIATTTNFTSNVNQSLPKTSTASNNTNIRQNNITTETNKILTTIPLINLLRQQQDNETANIKNKKSSTKISVKPINSLKSMNNNGKHLIIKKEPEEEKK